MEGLFHSRLLEREPGQQRQEDRPQGKVRPAHVGAGAQHEHRAPLDVLLHQDRLAVVEPGQHPGARLGAGIHPHVLVNQHRLEERDRLRQLRQRPVLLVQERDVPTVAVLLGVGGADLQQRRGEEFPFGLLVHLVIRFHLDVVAADPDQMAAVLHVGPQSLGRVAVRRGEVHAIDDQVIGERLGEQVLGRQRGGPQRPAGPARAGARACST